MYNNKLYFKFLYLGMILWMVACSQEKEEYRPPNVIIIFTDDQGYQDVGCFGAEDIATPHLDQMAQEGIRLTDFYATQAVCSASRAALLTGCYANRVGIHNALMPKAPVGLHPEETTIAEMLKPLGYHTAIFGKWHLGDHSSVMPWNQGFDEYFGIPYSNDMWPLHPLQGSVFNFRPLPLYDNRDVVDTLEDQSMLTTWITERSVQFIEKNKEEPFFLYVAHPQPHVPLFVSDKFKGKSDRGLYGDVIMEIDWSVGQILDALDRVEVEDRTLVIFTSDNGPWLSYGTHSGSAYPLREGKGTAWEGGQREPCIMRYPGELPAGNEISVPIMSIDLLPTIASVTGSLLPSSKIDGENVWNILTGVSEDNPHAAYFYYYRTNELHGVRYGKWKMYFPHSYRSLNGREGGKEGLPAPYEQLVLEKIELYDLSNDISEKNDVADLYPEVIDTISGLADGMRRKLGDKLTGIEGSENRAPAEVEW